MSTMTADTRSRTGSPRHAGAGPPAADPEGWTVVCDLARIPREGGVAAVVDGLAVAVFRTHDDRVFALGNIDPASGASVMSRGIVGTRGDVPFVASPLYKHPWDLQTGRRLDDPEQRVAKHPARVVDGRVVVGPRA